MEWHVIDAHNGRHIGNVISDTERGAKNMASRHVPYYHPTHCYVMPALTVNGKSITVEEI